jgi:hypothetical protein
LIQKRLRVTLVSKTVKGGIDVFRFKTSFIALVIVSLALAFSGCSGGSSAGNTGGSPSPTPTQVTVTCPSQIQVGVASTTYACTANVAVNWSVNNTALATISASGVLTPNQATTGTITVTGTPTGTGTVATVNVQVVDQIIYSVGGSGQIWIINSAITCC